jgi:hypothetical protein
MYAVETYAAVRRFAFVEGTVLEDDPADVLTALTSFIAGVQRKARATG